MAELIVGDDGSAPGGAARREAVGLARTLHRSKIPVLVVPANT